MTSYKLTVIASALLLMSPACVLAEVAGNATLSANSTNAEPDAQNQASDTNFTQESVNQLTVTPGVSFYRLQLPSFSLPFSVSDDISGTNYDSALLREFNPNQYTLAPTLGISYAFANPGILPGFFGHTISVDFNLLYQHINNRVNQDLNGTQGFIWPLTNKGAPDNDDGVNTFNSASVKTKVDHGDFALGVSGNHSLSQFLIVKPRISLVSTYLKQDYDYSILGYQQGAGNADFNGLGDETVKTYYFGLAIGSAFEFNVTKHISLYGDAEIQALHANSKFVGDQTTAGLNPGTAKPSHIESTDAVYTYRAKGAVGATFYSRDVNDASSLKVSLESGLDYWGYMPQIVNPDSSGESAHMARTTSLSNFINLKVSIPLM